LQERSRIFLACSLILLEQKGYVGGVLVDLVILCLGGVYFTFSYDFFIVDLCNLWFGREVRVILQQLFLSASPVQLPGSRLASLLSIVANNSQQLNA
jgi:hypothetical protein